VVEEGYRLVPLMETIPNNWYRLVLRRQAMPTIKQVKYGCSFYTLRK
jgi:hypothetical protein